MNMSEALARFKGLHDSGHTNLEIFNTVYADHPGDITASEDGSMAVFYFPEGVIILTPNDEVEAYITAPVKPPRPANCRERLREEGEPYPRSSCGACGANLRTGLICKHA